MAIIQVVIKGAHVWTSGRAAYSRSAAGLSYGVDTQELAC